MFAYPTQYHSKTMAKRMSHDLQAMAILALSCKIDQSNYSNNSRELMNLTLYHSSVEHFKQTQLQDGSFGNVYTTTLITQISPQGAHLLQALLSSGQESATDWNLNATIKYLIKQMNSSSVDFLSTYLTLPILNAKSLMDISKIDCSANPRKHGDDPVTDYLGPKMRVQYSLYVGDDKDFIHTMSLRVPENYTAFEVMELAQSVDPKYKYFISSFQILFVLTHHYSKMIGDKTVCVSMER
ncbi:UNVERIFIED_CONTAM: hypothetical protein NCL1_46899 [Trichonephila clavipes]